MNFRQSLLCVTCALLSFPLFAQNDSDHAAIEVATKTIRADEIRAHIRFLADSLLQGRAPGTPGYDVAAKYVATELEGMGLHPAVSGSWFQPVPLEKAVTDASASSLVLTVNGKEQKLVDAKDYILNTWFANPAAEGDSSAESDVSAALVFVGFGVTAPDQKYDDFAGVDVARENRGQNLWRAFRLSIHRARVLLGLNREGQECLGPWRCGRARDFSSRGLEALSVGLDCAASADGRDALAEWGRRPPRLCR